MFVFDDRTVCLPVLLHELPVLRQDAPRRAMRISERGKDMKVLIACEESQRVCTAFRKKGHEAYSCDIQECSGGHPEWHIQQDVLPLIDGNCAFITADGQTHEVVGEWDLIIAHPPCTDLASSGARWFERKRKDGSQQKSIDFFMQFVSAKCRKIVIENPIGVMSTYFRKPDQIIQPWQFGDGYQKSTCLWFIGDVSELVVAVTVKPDLQYHTWTDPSGKVKRQTQWYYNTRLQGKNRAKAASITPKGVASAMADQWG